MRGKEGGEMTAEESEYWAMESVAWEAVARGVLEIVGQHEDGTPILKFVPEHRR